jgi:hypothetical protein
LQSVEGTPYSVRWCIQADCLGHVHMCRVRHRVTWRLPRYAVHFCPVSGLLLMNARNNQSPFSWLRHGLPLPFSSWSGVLLPPVQFCTLSNTTLFCLFCWNHPPSSRIRPSRHPGDVPNTFSCCSAPASSSRAESECLELRGITRRWLCKLQGQAHSPWQALRLRARMRQQHCCHPKRPVTSWRVMSCSTLSVFDLSRRGHMKKEKVCMSSTRLEPRPMGESVCESRVRQADRWSAMQ